MPALLSLCVDQYTYRRTSDGRMATGHHVHSIVSHFDSAARMPCLERSFAFDFGNTARTDITPFNLDVFKEASQSSYVSTYLAISRAISMPLSGEAYEAMQDLYALTVHKPDALAIDFKREATSQDLDALEPTDRIEAGLPAALADAQADHWARAAEGIMTTDTLPKAFSAQAQVGGATVSITGISKGAGMIRPNMATMLGFLATDACVDASVVQQLARHLADRSFNRVTIDGDTSTNDSFVVIATGAAGLEVAHGKREEAVPRGDEREIIGQTRELARERWEATRRHQTSSSASAAWDGIASSSSRSCGESW